MSYRHPRWYDYGKTDEQLEREANWTYFWLILAAPFTFGATLIAAIVILCQDSWDSIPDKPRHRETGNEPGSYLTKTANETELI